MLLHILNREPDHVSSRQALQAMGPDDHLVLIEDAVTAVLVTQWEGWGIGPDRISVLGEDLASRRLATEAETYNSHTYQVIDINGLIELTVKYSRSVTWH